MEKRRKNIVAVRVLIVTLIAIAVVILIMVIVRQYENRYSKYVDKIDITYQDSNGTRTTNYVAFFNDDVIWDETDDKSGMAKYVIKLAMNEVRATETRNYNIIGQTAEQKVAFLYSKSKGTIILYEDGKSAEEIQYE